MLSLYFTGIHCYSIPFLRLLKCPRLAGPTGRRVTLKVWTHLRATALAFRMYLILRRETRHGPPVVRVRSKEQRTGVFGRLGSMTPATRSRCRPYRMRYVTCGTSHKINNPTSWLFFLCTFLFERSSLGTIKERLSKDAGKFKRTWLSRSVRLLFEDYVCTKCSFTRVRDSNP